MKLQFTKMHALGNDFIVIDDREFKLKNIKRLSKKLCNRRFGVGADQLLLLCHSDNAEFGMRIFNGDGSEVEMCGNGIRCIGKYIWDHIFRCDESSYARTYCQGIDVVTVETSAGIMTIHKTRNLFKVNMGSPIFNPGQIPLDMSRLPKKLHGAKKIMQHSLKVKSKTFKVNCISVGNPHAVIIVKDVESAPLEQYGALIENHKLFPNRVNVEFMQVMNKDNIKMRVWERGAGETMACGTGASASAVVSFLLKMTNRKVNVHLPGGKLVINWSEKDNNIYMTGPAETTYYGRIDI